MRITILTFSSYCIYVALPDISAFFFRTVRDWSEIIKTSSLPCPVVLRGVSIRKYRGGVTSDGGVKKYPQQGKQIKALPSPPALSRSIAGCFHKEI